MQDRRKALQEGQRRAGRKCRRVPPELPAMRCAGQSSPLQGDSSTALILSGDDANETSPFGLLCRLATAVLAPNQRRLVMRGPVGSRL
ncbi:hypothetical protein Hsero_2434 [Herbaspirillum seropedicae SmR1]|uniref:Uncharacterized protein n=1 Tax=Herbaspirillum seropedicae (strain SmR1) TaxID=757424 RepID=D8IVJ4_HERSS|nr:hypothetical protein Hsero_2434 [Herbaspirillum seropedicae SmR1]